MPAAPVQRRSAARKVPAGTLYRGREGMWSWVAHRVTGVAIFFFLLVHVLDTALVRVSPEAYNEVDRARTRTRSWASWRPASSARSCSTRSTASGSSSVDFWGRARSYQRVRCSGSSSGLCVVTMAGFLPRHLMHVFGGE